MSEATILPYWAHVQEPKARGSIKSSPEDFRVEEVLGFKPAGSGEHVYLFIEKRDVNTQDLIKSLARQLHIHVQHISYAGLKDKNAVTRQWISVYTAKDIDIAELESPEIKILESSRHRRKLKRGAHQANRFDIVIRNLSDTGGIKQGIERVLRHGVPNYYGEQRFGKSGNNIEKARALFAGINTASRHQRGLYLSAARSFLFNEILSERVRQKNWATGLQGEVMMLDGSNSFFKSAELDEQLRERLARFDIHPSAPLWGTGALSSSGAAFALESSMMNRYSDITQGLEFFGLRQQRRATRLVPQSLRFEYPEDNSLRLSFLLPVGTFATTILRELITIRRSV